MEHFWTSPLLTVSRIGVLDECTSAVSVEVEEKVYTAARELGITCITISQRLALTDFHSQELRLGEATMKGWELHDIVVSDHSDQPGDCTPLVYAPYKKKAS